MTTCIAKYPDRCATEWRSGVIPKIVNCTRGNMTTECFEGIACMALRRFPDIGPEYRRDMRITFTYFERLGGDSGRAQYISGSGKYRVRVQFFNPTIEPIYLFSFWVHQYSVLIHELKHVEDNIKGLTWETGGIYGDRVQEKRANAFAKCVREDLTFQEHYVFESMAEERWQPV